MPIDPSKVKWDDAPAIDPSQVQWDAPKQQDSGGFGQMVGDLAAGAVRGAGSIGATLLAPLDAAARGQDRVVVLVRDLILDHGFRHPFQLLDILLDDFIIDFSLTDITIDFRI